MTRNALVCRSNIVLLKCCVYVPKFDTLQWLTVTAKNRTGWTWYDVLLFTMCNYRYAGFSACHGFFSPIVCHSPSQSWASSIGLVSLESRSWSWTLKSWSWNCWVLVLVLVLDKQVFNPGLFKTHSLLPKEYWTFWPVDCSTLIKSSMLQNR